MTPELDYASSPKSDEQLEWLDKQTPIVIYFNDGSFVHTTVAGADEHIARKKLDRRGP